MLIENIRSEVKKMYSSEKWRRKVARMSDNQVIAIYHRTHNKKKKAEEKTAHISDNEVTEAHIHTNFEQLTFEDVMNGGKNNNE